jgi:hypothetical protein
MPTTLPTVLDFYNAKDDADALAEIVNGDVSTDVTTRYGGDIPTIKKVINEVRRSNSAYSFQTLALLNAAGTPEDITGDPDGVTDIMARVWNDLTEINNGLYGWDGSAWVKSLYDPVDVLTPRIDDNDAQLTVIKKLNKPSLHRDAVVGFPYSIIQSDGRVLLAIDSNGNLVNLTVNQQGAESNFKHTDKIKPLHRDNKSGYLWSLTQADGTVLLGVNSAGELVNETTRKTNAKADFSVIDLQKRGSRDAVSQYAYVIRDHTGKVALGIDNQGVIYGDTLQMPISQSERDVSGIIWAIRDTEGRVAIGVNADGSLVGAASAGSSYIPPATLDFDCFNIRQGVGFYVATVQDSDRLTYDVKQITGSETALIQHRLPLLFNPIGGQSNAGQGGETGLLFTDAAYEHSCMMFSTLSAAYGTSVATALQLSAFVPASDLGKNGQFPATLSSFAFESRYREFYNKPSSGVLAFTSWYGGQPITSMVRGTTTWDNLMLGASQAVVVAAQYNKTVECRHYTFIQGENSTASYETLLIAYAADVCGELKTVLGQVGDIEFVYLQINSPEDASAANSIEQAQLNAATTPGMTLAGPMYDAPLGDNVHQSPIGRMIIAERLANVYAAIEKGETFEPLWPVSVAIGGAFITVVFNKSIAIDSDWMPSVPNFGFVYTDSTSSATIASVDIIAADTIRITLSNTPSGTSKKIKYAVITETDVDGWANGRGLIYSPTTQPSFYYAQGFAVPEFLRLYAVRFTEDL